MSLTAQRFSGRRGSKSRIVLQEPSSDLVQVAADRIVGYLNKKGDLYVSSFNDAVGVLMGGVHHIRQFGGSKEQQRYVLKLALRQLEREHIVCFADDGRMGLTSPNRRKQTRFAHRPNSRRWPISV